MEQVDTIIKRDTIFNTFVITDTVPVIKTKKVFLTDTLWRSNGDSIVGEPQILTFVKKKS